MAILIIYPSSYYDLYKVDEDLSEEYEAEISTGLFDTIFFGYSQWFDEGRLVLTQKPLEKRNAIYRGWMMKPDKYKVFYEKMLDNNIHLITTPDEYELMHIFPNIYPQIVYDTARTLTFPLDKEIDVNILNKNFDMFMIKDYVKSVKGTNFPKYFKTPVSQPDFNEWIRKFYEYRGNLLTGGICVKEYLSLKKYGDKTNEFRVFYCNGEVLSICRNSLQPDFVAQPPLEMIFKYKNLQSLYYTLDFAELDNGIWKIIEAGDGGVSGLSPNQDIVAYYRSLYKILE